MKNNYIKKTLKNGVKLYLYLDKNMKQYYVDYMIDYGSSGIWYDFYLDDKHYHVLPGCAHFLEHLLGEHSKYGNFYQYLASKKYYKNGSTGAKVTHYYFRGTQNILDLIEKLINVIDDPVFTKKDVEETKLAIAEETKRGKNNKFRTLYSLLEKNLYKDFNLAHETLSSIGDEKTTYKIDYDMLKNCYDAFYYDENKTLLIAGNFDEKEITDYVESVYSKLKPHKKRLKEFKYKNIDKIKKKYEIYNMATDDDLMGIIFKQFNNNYSKKEIHYYLNFILFNSFDDSSDFIKKMKNKNIIVNINNYYKNFVFDDNFNFGVVATIKNKNIFEKKLVKKLKNKKYKEKDFNLYIKSLISFNASKIDNKYIYFETFPFTKEFSDDFDDMDFIKTLTFENFKKFYKSLNFDDYVIGIITNK